MSLLMTTNTHWPIAVAVAQGKPSMEQHMRALDDWDRWLSIGEPFHIIRFFDDTESLKTPAGAGKITQAWMAAGVDTQIKTFVQSMMIIVPKDQYDRFSKVSVTKVFKIPGGIFISLYDAFDWLERQQGITDIFDIDKNQCNNIQQTINTLIKNTQ